MGPKTFIACYVCFKEFGSKSIIFHEPKCLERWRSSNKALPAEKRTSTPVKPPAGKNSGQNNNNNNNNTWVCSHCQTSESSSKKGEDASVGKSKKLKSNNTNSPEAKPPMTGVVKTDFSPKKGKENKSSSNNIPVLSVVKKNAKNAAKIESKDTADITPKDNEPKHGIPRSKSCDKVIESVQKSVEEVNCTSKRSVRPQTKILRRPTPNLKHPVIQIDSDDSSGDSSCSDKGKDDNPKRLKMGNESSDSAHKPKNFIMYNKNNVDKNTKIAFRERTSATTVAAAIPNPCNSCNRSQAPERLHSHAKKDARGLMYRKSPTLDIKMASPQKKMIEPLEKKNKSGNNKNGKSAQLQEIAKQETAQACALEECNSDNKIEHLSVPSVETLSEKYSEEKELVDLERACYICQKEFKVSALFLHESKCLESWKKTNNSLTPNLRKLPPRRPEDADELPTDEADPAWQAVQSQLVPCSVCGRTFFPERLPVHRRVCKGKPSPKPLKRASSLREQSASSTDGEDSKPAAIYVPCYVCGRNYGSWVISMHEQQCLRKWRGDNDKLPAEEQREEPQKFPSLSSDDDVASLIELGDNAWESHLQQLVPCPLCSRTFFPDRLGVHKRSCKGPANCSSRRPRSNKGA